MLPTNTEMTGHKPEERECYWDCPLSPRTCGRQRMTAHAGYKMALSEYFNCLCLVGSTWISRYQYRGLGRIHKAWICPPSTPNLVSSLHQRWPQISFHPSHNSQLIITGHGVFSSDPADQASRWHANCCGMFDLTSYCPAIQNVYLFMETSWALGQEHRGISWTALPPLIPRWSLWQKKLSKLGIAT